MWIDELEIEGFRGLPASLRLDLRAPLTVLYAANGTGKSSICDAAEWLMTGKVARLENAASNIADLIQCWYPKSGSQCRARAHVRIGSRSLQIERRLQGPKSTLRRVDDAGGEMSES